jgi:hypothetical protein
MIVGTIVGNDETFCSVCDPLRGFVPFPISACSFVSDRDNKEILFKACSKCCNGRRYLSENSPSALQ